LRLGRTLLAVKLGLHRTVLGHGGRADRMCLESPRSAVERTLSKDAAMKTLITDEQLAQLLANGQARAEGRQLDPLPVVRLFTPDAHATWLLTELDPEDGDTVFGLCDVGLGMPKLGYVRLSELASIRGPSNQLIERDLYFTARRSLSEYARLAQENGSITD
jgi:hypothetical protein